MAAVGARRRWRKRIVLLLVAIVAIGMLQYLYSRVSSGWRELRVVGTTSAVGEQAPAELRIVIYNIAHGRALADSNWSGEEESRQRLESIGERLREFQPDVVVLNEVDFASSWSNGINQAEIVAGSAGITQRAEERNIDLAMPFFQLAFGNVIMSRFPIVDARVVDLPAYSRLEALGAGKKKALLCTLEIARGHRVRLLAVHLEHRSERLRVAAARCIEALRGESDVPLIAAGDFNSSPIGYPVTTPDADGQTALSLLLEGGGFRGAVQEAPGVDDFTFPSDRPDRAIDWVLAPADWKMLEHRPVDLELSDHRPVFARVKVP